jgi:hypothetical protein
VDQDKIVAILDMVAPTYGRDLHTTLGHTGYYMWFIQSYVDIVASLDKILHKDIVDDYNCVLHPSEHIPERVSP